MNESNFLYHCRGACFNPYKLFFNLHTRSSFPLTSNPYGCCMKISSFKSPWRNAILTSNYSISRSWLVANPKIVLINENFTTGEKISSKSIPFFWPKLFTTNWALYFTRFHFPSFFSLYTHLFRKAFFPLGNFTSS